MMCHCQVAEQNLRFKRNFADTEQTLQTKSAQAWQVNAQGEVHAGAPAVDTLEHSMVCMHECPPVQRKDVYWASAKDLLPQQHQGNPIQTML